jgi:DHA1 family multidrug resistance protein-like MFS transporter
MRDIIRDSTLGQLVNKFSLGRLLPYADQKSDLVLPEKYRHLTLTPTATITSDSPPLKLLSLDNISGLATPPTPPESAHIDDDTTTLRHSVVGSTTAVADAAQCRLRSGVGDKETGLEKGNPSCETVRDELVIAKLHPELRTAMDPYLVDWDGPNDPDNPRYAI